MVIAPTADTRHRKVYLEIRRGLLLGAFPPDHRFKASELCAEYDSSVSVIREALTLLSEQGLIRREPHKGFSVLEINEAQVNDIAFMRIELESLAVRRSIERGGAEWEVGVVAAHHHLSIVPNLSVREDPAANEVWIGAHRAFHEACGSACGSDRLIATLAQLFHQSEVVRQLAKLEHGHSRDVAGEHRAIADAVVSRDSERAVGLIRDHLNATRESCIQALSHTQRQEEQWISS